jgi:hypothetical protein
MRQLIRQEGTVNTSRKLQFMSKVLRRVKLPASIAVAALSLVACAGGGVTPSQPASGGGGAGGTASPYLLFASNYQTYSAQTDGAYIYSIQNGDLYGIFQGNLNYGCYSSPQGLMDSVQFYAIAFQADVTVTNNGNTCTPNGGAVPNLATDLALIAIHAPGTSSVVVPGATALAPFDISQSASLLIQMGNIWTAGDVPGQAGGSATVFTVVLNNDTSLAQDGSGQTAICAHDVALGTIGRGVAAPRGVLNYNLALADAGWLCSKGSVAVLKSTGITSIVVEVVGSKQNPAIQPGEANVLAVGYVGFTL